MIKTKIYENGLKLIVENMQNFESVAFNIFVKTGSANETPENYGISHYIEHMLFKGTKTRTSLDISKKLDAIGANVNAYTSEEETVYHTKSTAENAETCVEILSDMLFNSMFDKKEMSREKRVVVEEIKMYNDNAESLVYNITNQAFYENTPLSHDVAGSILSVRKLTREQILEYMQKYYVPKNITLSFAGNIDFKTAEEYVEKYFSPFFKSVGKEVDNKFKNNKKINVAKKYKDNEQSQVCISFPGLYRGDYDFYVAKIFNTAFGRGMSSILFQTIREKLGLVYTISSGTVSNCGGGDTAIYFGTSTKNVPLALIAIAEEINKVVESGLTDEQFEDAKNNVISSIKISFESTASVCLYNAKNFSFLNTVITKEEYVKKLEAVTQADINNFVKKVFDKNNFTIGYVGNNTRYNLLKYFNIK